MKKILMAILLLVSVNALAQDNFIQGFDYSSSTGLMSWTSLRDLIEKARFDRGACDSTNNFYLANPTYFLMSTNTGAGYTNYYLNIRQGSLTSDLLAGGGYPTLGGDNTWTGTNTFNGQVIINSNDMAISYMGFPKLTLTTNMVTFQADGGGTLATNNFDLVIDQDITTCATGQYSTSGHWYVFDLGANYQGYALCKVLIENSSGSLVKTWQMTQLNNSDFDWQNQQSAGYCQTTDGSTNDYMIATPSNGRYFIFYISSAAGGAEDYMIYDISLYGTTNSYRNMGGW